MNIQRLISEKKIEITIFSALVLFLLVVGVVFVEPKSSDQNYIPPEQFLAEAEEYPDGFLIVMAAQGHTIQKHVGKTDEYLRYRLDNERIPAASTFLNIQEAEAAIRDVLLDRSDLIQIWLDTGRSQRKAFYSETSKPIGRVIERGNADVLQANATRIILVRDDASSYGFSLLTAYPEIRR